MINIVIKIKENNVNYIQIVFLISKMRHILFLKFYFLLISFYYLSSSFKLNHLSNPIASTILISMETAGGEVPRRRSNEEAAAAQAVAAMTCPVCKRTFSSTKAMHGHLRTHPERNYRGTNPNPRAKPSKKKTPAAGDGSRQPVVISTDFLILTAERERSQSTGILERSMIKEETKVDREDGGCSTSTSAAAPPRKYEHRRRRMSFSSYQASEGHKSARAIKISPLMAAAEVGMLSEKEWIAVDALKLLGESAVSTPTLAATHSPLTFDLTQPPSPLPPPPPPPPPADQR